MQKMIHISVLQKFYEHFEFVLNAVTVCVLPEILWNIPSHKEAFGFTDTMNSPFPLFTCATTCEREQKAVDVYYKDTDTKKCVSQSRLSLTESQLSKK